MMHPRTWKTTTLVVVLAICLFFAGVPAGAAVSGQSAVVGNDVFLEGKYLSVGISGSGSFGTAGAAPAGFHPTAFYEGEIGLSADQDGFDTGNPPINGDFFLPGSPEERFNVGYKIQGTPSTYSNAEREGQIDIPRESITNLSHDNILSARWTGIVSHGEQQMMRVTQTVEFKADQKFFKNTIQLDNLSKVALDSVRYMRNVDPDQDEDLSGTYTTINDVLAQPPGDKKALVRAEGPITHTPIFYYSSDARARASTFGFSNTNPYFPAAYDAAGVYDYSTYISALGSVTEDQAISICADLGTLLPGAHGTFVYYTSLDADFENALKKIEGEEQATDIEPPVVRLPDYALDSLHPLPQPAQFTLKGTSCDLLTNVTDNAGGSRVTVLDNGQTLATNAMQNGFHTYHLELAEGINSLEVVAVDMAGNRASVKFILDADSTGPVISLNALPASVSSASATIGGQVTDHSGVRSLTINGLTVVPYADGTFSQSVPLSVGTNMVVVEAIDNRGNSAHKELVIARSSGSTSQKSLYVVLTIGSTGMEVNGVVRKMDAAPFIKDGRTLLPIRALIEALGGSVQWNPAMKTATVMLGSRTVALTIGSKTALVNGKPVSLDVAPMIVEGRTFLPLRAVAENLGLDLAWEPVSQTISFTYWP
jgi:hypothetical protein